MRRLITIIMLISTMVLVFACAPAKGQTNSVISIDTAGMPANVKAAINAKMQTDAVTQKIETYGKWAGMGKEIGVAAKEGLTAVKDFAVDVSETNVGKTVLFLIIWKVAGIDFVRILLATIFAFVSIWLISKSYFTLLGNRRLIEKSGWWIFGTKKYEYPSNKDERGYVISKLDGITDSWAAGLHWFFLCIMIGMAALIAFV